MRSVSLALTDTSETLEWCDATPEPSLTPFLRSLLLKSTRRQEFLKTEDHVKKRNLSEFSDVDFRAFTGGRMSEAGCSRTQRTFGKFLWLCVNSSRNRLSPGVPGFSSSCGRYTKFSGIIFRRPVYADSAHFSSRSDYGLLCGADLCPQYDMDLGATSVVSQEVSPRASLEHACAFLRQLLAVSLNA